MLNAEKYRDEIMTLIEQDKALAVLNNKITYCGMISECKDCLFARNCDVERTRWLLNEAKPTLTPKERGFCEIVGEGYIARDDDGSLYYYDEEPSKTDINWENKPYDITLMIHNNYFDFITWDDKKPWAIEDLLELEVEE